ncbi:hypothetical protein [Sphingomonas panacisoli]|uniref:hypothetical protein n=1 Tax=Sphingomonas panacisoli TaxID=1813879 RepID=UPI001644C7D2|nr:hypothetical protein [Sphingomonas panacisoli]
MDLNYLFHRHQVSMMPADAASNGEVVLRPIEIALGNAVGMAAFGNVKAAEIMARSSLVLGIPS